jgi:hypothetical protein
MYSLAWPMPAGLTGFEAVDATNAMLSSMSALYTTAQFDKHFEFGLHALIEGIELRTGP